MSGLLIVISGFSGAGKGTVLKNLMSTYDNYCFSVSMTTRKPREGEQDGVDYFFVSREEFEKTISENGLVEYAEYCGNYYGTPKAYVDKQLAMGKNVVLDIEVQGAAQIKKKFPDTLMVFVVPPSIDTLLKRLRARGTESEEVIQRRITQAKEEVKRAGDYEYIVINDDLDAAVKELHGIVEAAKCTTGRRRDFISEITTELSNI